ncbi:Maf family protein [Parerythrobacter lacustris]|uniref:Nucleoside triphosphate pyrophosphatase n=1 Tax=Parerythrobacter lacustris TaxID=2969984 RepID=A0ABT1XS53_9SPHN|nr:Maf family protein [Parerythrobacter lacustris]MCR2834470.1 Maf family protein [Parerythrobacter lacustris]
MTARVLSGSGFILASKSASRRAMLDAAGLAYEAIPAGIDERALEIEMAGSPAEEVAQALAVAKAAAVSAVRPDAWVLGSDSLVAVEGRRFDKPVSRDDAADHLRAFSGKVIELHSAASLVRGGKPAWVGHDIACLSVRNLSEDFIAEYLDAEWPEVSHCVGVFRIEALGVQLFDRIDGDQFTVLGMPLLQVLGALRELGVLTT